MSTVGADRLHHLDALRALTMFLLLPAHALTLIGLQRGGWNDLEDSVFWAIHVFRLPLFFLVAGFFAALVLDLRGLPNLLRNRAIRIGIPLMLGVLTVAPLLSLSLHAASNGNFRPEETVLATFTTPRPSYLWFLWYLMLLYVGALGIRRMLGSRKPFMALRGAGAWLLSHRLGPILSQYPQRSCSIGNRYGWRVLQRTASSQNSTCSPITRSSSPLAGRSSPHPACAI